MHEHLFTIQSIQNDSLLRFSCSSQNSIYIPTLLPGLRRCKSSTVQSVTSICPGSCAKTKPSICAPADSTAICGVTPHAYQRQSVAAPRGKGFVNSSTCTRKTYPEDWNFSLLKDLRLAKVRLINICDTESLCTVPPPGHWLSMC